MQTFVRIIAAVEADPLLAQRLVDAPDAESKREVLHSAGLFDGISPSELGALRDFAAGTSVPVTDEFLTSVTAAGSPDMQQGSKVSEGGNPVATSKYTTEYGEVFTRTQVAASATPSTGETKDLASAAKKKVIIAGVTTAVVSV